MTLTNTDLPVNPQHWRSPCLEDLRVTEFYGNILWVISYVGTFNSLGRNIVNGGYSISYGRGGSALV